MSELEDKLLRKYHDENGGKMIMEVAVAWSKGLKNWEGKHSHRAIDGVRIPDAETEEIGFPGNGDEVLDSIKDSKVELIEVKKKLNRPVIGQVLAGEPMLEADYSPKSIEKVVICQKSDSALEWVCEKKNIRLEVFDV